MSTRSPSPDLILKMAAVRSPALPDLPFDIALQVFTDVSLRPAGDSGANRSDNEVLAIVGHSISSAILTSILFNRKPALNSEQLTAAREEWESEENLMVWINYHKDTIRQLRCAPGTTINFEKQIRTWYAYMGGVYLTKGYQVLDQFLRQLVDPDSPPPPAGDSRMPTGGRPPGTSAPPNKTDGHAGQFTAFLHMAASQRGSKVEFEYEQSGMAHAPTWTANVVVDGLWRGQGIAANKKLANEEAAKAALDKLQWH